MDSKIFTLKELNFAETRARLIEDRRIWGKKASLRKIYTDYFEVMFTHCVSGSTLEVGAGFGSLKESGQNVISTDIVKMPSLDLVSDAHLLPFSSGTFENIVGVDVLHHLESPVKFLQEARRILKTKGRVVLLEPGITPVSNIFFKVFHSEVVDMSANPLCDVERTGNRHPFDSNQAVATLLATKYRRQLPYETGLFLQNYKWLGSMAYPLSGGFRRWSLIPSSLVATIMAAEKRLDVKFGHFFASRILLVLSKWSE